MKVPWSKIEEAYSVAAKASPERKIVFDSMARLCAFIDQSSLSEVLYGFTSHQTLFISQIETSYVPHHSISFLKIEPKADGRIEFRYVDTNVVDRQWSREVEPAEVTPRFELFLDQIKWRYSGKPQIER